MKRRGKPGDHVFSGSYLSIQIMGMEKDDRDLIIKGMTPNENKHIIRCSSERWAYTGLSLSDDR
jgi:hypothetical protein